MKCYENRIKPNKIGLFWFESLIWIELSILKFCFLSFVSNDVLFVYTIQTWKNQPKILHMTSNLAAKQLNFRKTRNLQTNISRFTGRTRPTQWGSCNTHQRYGVVSCRTIRYSGFWGVREKWGPVGDFLEFVLNTQLETAKNTEQIHRKSVVTPETSSSINDTKFRSQGIYVPLEKEIRKCLAF